MKSKRIVYLLVFMFLFACITVSCKKGNGMLVTEEINIEDYDAINITGSAVVNYEQVGGPPYLKFTIDENILKNVNIYVKKGTLHVSLKNKGNVGVSYTSYIVNTNSRNLSDINSSGSGKINLLSDVKTDDLNIELSGSGSVNSEKSVIVNTLKSSISGSGKVSLKGESETCILEITGSGRITSSGFSTAHLKCHISGSGKVEMHVTESIECNISGSGNLTYSGEPSSVNHSVNGSGKLVKR